MIEEKLLDVKQAAEILGVKTSCLYQWSQQRRHLIFIKVGGSLRIREKDLMEFIDKRRKCPIKE